MPNCHTFKQCSNSKTVSSSKISYCCLTLLPTEMFYKPTIPRVSKSVTYQQCLLLKVGIWQLNIMRRGKLPAPPGRVLPGPACTSAGHVDSWPWPWQDYPGHLSFRLRLLFKCFGTWEMKRNSVVNNQMWCLVSPFSVSCHTYLRSNCHRKFLFSLLIGLNCS